MHEQEKKLLLEKDNVRNVDTKLGRMQRKRGNREGENRRFDLLVVLFQQVYVCLLRFKVKTLMFRFREEVER